MKVDLESKSTYPHLLDPLVVHSPTHKVLAELNRKIDEKIDIKQIEKDTKDIDKYIIYLFIILNRTKMHRTLYRYHPDLKYKLDKLSEDDLYKKVIQDHNREIIKGYTYIHQNRRVITPNELKQQKEEIQKIQEIKLKRVSMLAKEIEEYKKKKTKEMIEERDSLQQRRVDEYHRRVRQTKWLIVHEICYSLELYHFLKFILIIFFNLFYY